MLICIYFQRASIPLDATWLGRISCEGSDTFQGQPEQEDRHHTQSEGILTKELGETQV